MTLRDFRKQTQLLPSNTEIFVYKSLDVPTWDEPASIMLAAIGHSPTGPYPDPYTKELKPKIGIFIK